MSQTTISGQPVPGDVLDRLKAIVGPGGFIEGAEDTAAYTRPWRGKWNGRTPLVLRPKSTEEVAAIVKLCAETCTSVVRRPT
jgi:FAD/FMN-containing dehydrogenase